MKRTASADFSSRLFLLAILTGAACTGPAMRPSNVAGTTPSPDQTTDERTAELEIIVDADASCSSGQSRIRVIVGIPSKIDVPAGPAHVACSAEGHREASADLTAEAGKTTRVALKLKQPSPSIAGAVSIEPKSGLEFVYIPAGSFHFGCEPQDAACSDNEKPGSTQTVRAFRLGKTDVTVAAYDRCVSAHSCGVAETGLGCNYGTDKSDQPINCVDVDSQARAFCIWIGGRLPSAEEWEYAAKGGESRVYPWGDQAPDDRRAKYASHDGTAPVGSHPEGASKLGLLDMAGNVWQWTSSDYDRVFRELRGGGWADPATDLRASHRSGYSPSVRHTDIGFRCAL